MINRPSRVPMGKHTQVSGFSLSEHEVFGEPKPILIDINVLGISSMHQWAYKDRTSKGKPTAAIQGTLEKLSRLSSVFPGHVPIVLWDDRCHWREEILPRYKRHRWETPEQLAFLESYLAQAAVGGCPVRS